MHVFISKKKKINTKKIWFKKLSSDIEISRPFTIDRSIIDLQKKCSKNLRFYSNISRKFHSNGKLLHENKFWLILCTWLLHNPWKYCHSKWAIWNSIKYRQFPKEIRDIILLIKCYKLSLFTFYYGNYFAFLQQCLFDVHSPLIRNSFSCLHCLKSRFTQKCSY